MRHLPALILATLSAASIAPAQTPITLTSSPNPSIFGQAVTLTATISNSSGVAVRFFDGAVRLDTGGIVTNDSGVATFFTSVLAIGTHSLTAAYTTIGTTGITITSNAVTHVVNPPAPAVTFNASPNPSNYCGSVVLTATVTPPAGSGATPTGTVTFTDGAATLATRDLANGSATFSTSSLAAGSHPLSASYSGDRAWSPASATTTLTVNQAATSTALTAAPNPSTFGQNVTLTATVTSPCGASGNVTFLDGANLLASAALSNGSATLVTTALPAGTRSLTARYAGDANNAASASSAVTQVVNKVATSTVLASSLNPSVPSQAVTLTARVTPAGATGSVNFTDGPVSLGSAALSNGTATLTTSFATAGTHTLSASYTGDPNYAASLSPAVSQLVAAAQSSITTLTVNPTTAALGQTVTLTAAVTPASAAGTVTFLDGATTLSTQNLSGGSASYTTSSLAAGSHSLTASYNGSSAVAASVSAAVTLTIARTATAITLTAAPSSAELGQPVVLTAAVTPAAASGTVTFRDGSATIGTGTLANGKATFTTSSLGLGTHLLAADYEGNSTYNPSSSSQATLVVGKRTTTLTLAAAPSSTVPGQQVLLTATISPAAAGGTVTFRDGNSVIGTGTLQNGTATFRTSTLASGNHTVTASYPGDTSYAASTADSVTVSVGLPGTLLTLAATPGSAPYGQSVTLTAKITPVTAAGTVTFFDGAAPLTTVNLVSGTATTSISTLAPGSHTLKATYNGDPTNATSTSNTVTVVVSRASTTTTLSAEPNPSPAGQPLTITATVAPAGATGTVTFRDGTATLGTAPLSGGRAELTTSALAQGTHSLTASYPGDANFNASSSSAVSHTVSPPSTTLTITGPASLPTGSINTAYPAQTFTATGGNGSYTWSLVPGGTSTSDLHISPAGVLTGTPQRAGTYQIMVQVQDSSTPTPASATRTYIVNFTFPAVPTISLSVNAQPQTPADQPVPQLTLAQGYPVALRGTFTLSFSPNAADLPANYTNDAVQFAAGGATAQATIPANSTAPVSLPAIQIGSVAGNISVRLTALADLATGLSIPLPSPLPNVAIAVPRIAPVIAPGSVRIAAITATGFQITFDANSTPRDITRANVTFTAASGATLTGTQTYPVDLAAAGTAWFPSAPGVSAGGAFSVQITFGFTGDTSALGSASVTLTNSVGTSAAVSGGR